mmetsp:Transcript_9952/g.14122  ORF Transcript_9952/g.14122 Transcript_9952/m.14122 type:complete len:166 (+) Transcript_9952:53-550(+)
MDRCAAALACLLGLAIFGSQSFVLPVGVKAPAEGQQSVLLRNAASLGEEPVAASWSSPMALGAAVGLLAAVVTAGPVKAADIENGEAIFTGNCAACHAGGNNTVVPEKKLKKDALVAYDKFAVDKIITQVTNGNGQMPAFGDKLAPDDIEDVASYVFDQASGNKW